MSVLSSEHRYSADVRLTLLVGNTVVPLAQISRDWVMLRENLDVAPGRAEVVMTVDGRERRWDVSLDGPPCETTLKIPISV